MQGLDPVRLALTLPDEPRWVDLRGLLFSRRCDLFAPDDGTRGFAARSWDFPFVGIAGDPGKESVLQALKAAPPLLRVLAQEESAEALAEAFPAWQRQGVFLHRFEGPWPQVPPVSKTGESGVEIRVAEGRRAAGWGLDLSAWPQDVQAELELVATSPRALAVAVAGREVVAACFAALETETLWDVAVDTREDFRRQGWASACFAALCQRLAKRGKRPVWGAMDDNEASLAMARKLGFARSARLWSFLPQGSLEP